MSVGIGIVGLPNTGKSTLFNALTKQSVPAENFPFCTIDPSVGIVSVPDDRLETLAGISASAKVIPAAVRFVDIAGLVRGASSGEGLGNEFLSHIRTVDAVAHMVRCFQDSNVVHVDGEVDPVRDIEVIETELLLADLQVAEACLDRAAYEVKRQNKEAAEQLKTFTEIVAGLKQGKPLSQQVFRDEEQEYVRACNFLTNKPVLYICNIGDTYDKHSVAAVREYAQGRGRNVVVISALAEQEFSQVSAEEATLLRKELSVDGDEIDAIIRGAYKTLGLISFFTTGEKETRAWTVPKGATAPQAGHVIHSDFETNFIRAEVISYEELQRVGSYAQAREEGVLRVEGKTYVVQDGDVIVFRVG